MRSLALTLLAGAVLISGVPGAQADRLDSGVRIAQAEALSEGEVRKIDKDAGKITLRHGPIANLDMPAMTMVFRAQDPTLLDRVKVGDKVRFSAEKVGGQITVTMIDKL